ncbi:uncharacterized protein LOC124844523 isoform X4 [Vigna umbellata]|uniref:uncharacterized protein LOC124844523 isoform X4 n=1 Tax=Vigna umbellata TaxID=87088 RepID=UPI001F5F5E6C|nr:uncharacterized protein LOC124844523 isoform X4 [Vigna umbellata]
MSFQKGVVVFLPILLSLVLLHHLFLTSVVSAQSENLTRRLLSIEDDELTQSELHTSLLLSPSQSQKNAPNDSNIEVNSIISDPYIPPFPPTIQMESDVSINSNLEVNSNPEVQRTKESASNDRVLHDEL